MMMNKALAFVALACIWQYGECAITGWTAPTISSAAGAATHGDLINEGATGATGITIAATSDDTVGGVTAYLKVSQTPAAPVLAIDNSGDVTITSGTVAYASGSTAMEIVVSANDGGGTASTATVTININALPVIGSHSASYCIADASTEGADLADLTAIDANTGQTLAWTIASGDANGDFAITSAGGLIQVAASKTLDMSTTASYTLVITVEDDSTTVALTVSTTLTATVQATCSGSAAITLSFITFLAALLVTKLS